MAEWLCNLFFELIVLTSPAKIPHFLNRRPLKVIILAVKLLITVYTCSYVYYKLFVSYNIDDLYRQYRQSVGGMAGWAVVLTVLLMVANWSIEALKWQYLIKRKETIGFRMAFKAVLSGTTISLITPNRIGEYAGRVVYLETYDKVKAALTTMVGSFAQLCITLVAGCICLCVELKHILPQMDLARQTLVFLCLILVGLILLLYYNIWLIAPVSRRIPFIKKYARYFEEFEQYTYTDLTILLGYSLIRYTVFTVQYVLMLYAFRTQVEVADALKVIPVIFLVQSIVPTSTLTEIGLRGYSAIVFFAFYSTNEVSLTLSAYGLWIINLIFPAFVGLILLLRVRFLKADS